MKSALSTVLSLCLLCGVLSILNACDSDTIIPGPANQLVEDVEPVYLLSDEEEAGLVYMREEEKLARDVYILFFEKFGIQSFNNISNSEQIHMDLILDLLNKYDIPDPALKDNGAFSNQQLQDLYNNLIALGQESQIAALTIGATIEDVDIKDLNGYISGTKQADIISTYELLNCGSRNHMRAFVRQLDNRGTEYTPQYISMDEFDLIINGEHEKCGQLYR